jgi:hypothetical protein
MATARQLDTGATLQIVKLDSEQRIITGWVAIVEDADGNPIVDSDGHMIPITELQKAVADATSGNAGEGKGGDMHETSGLMDYIGGVVLSAKDREAGGFGHGPGGWLAQFRVRDEQLWKRIKDGERPELSMRGTGEAVEI